MVVTKYFACSRNTTRRGNRNRRRLRLGMIVADIDCVTGGNPRCRASTGQPRVWSTTTAEIPHRPERGPDRSACRLSGRHSSGITECWFGRAHRPGRRTDLIRGPAVALNDCPKRRHADRLGRRPVWRVGQITVDCRRAGTFLPRAGSIYRFCASCSGPSSIRGVGCRASNDADKTPFAANCRCRKLTTDHARRNCRVLRPNRDGVIAGARAVAEVAIPGGIIERHGAPLSSAP